MLRHISELSSNDLAYIAGLVDGEGSIYACYDKQCPNKPFRFRVSISLTEEFLINWLKYVTGLGYITLHPKQKRKHKQAYKWTLNTTEGAVFLSFVLPFLKIKKSQAELFLYYFKGNGEDNIFVGECLRDLNKRGID